MCIIYISIILRLIFFSTFPVLVRNNTTAVSLVHRSMCKHFLPTRDVSPNFSQCLVSPNIKKAEAPPVKKTAKEGLRMYCRVELDNMFGFEYIQISYSSQWDNKWAEAYAGP
jgi:hypothetical protein